MLKIGIPTLFLQRDFNHRAQKKYPFNVPMCGFLISFIGIKELKTKHRGGESKRVEVCERIFLFHTPSPPPQLFKMQIFFCINISSC